VPSDHLQAEDRAYRIGQDKTVNVHYLQAVGTIDEIVAELLAAKLEIISSVVEGKEIENNDIFGDLVKLFWERNMVK
jgi:SNF2 family DNA or RNA helicase